MAERKTMKVRVKQRVKPTRRLAGAGAASALAVRADVFSGRAAASEAPKRHLTARQQAEWDAVADFFMGNGHQQTRRQVVAAENETPQQRRRSEQLRRDRRRKIARLWVAGTGMLLAGFLALASLELIRDVLSFGDPTVYIPMAGVAGAVLALTRARSVLWIAGGVLAIALGVVGFSSLTVNLMPGLMRNDPLEQAPAVVVLSSTLVEDGKLCDKAQERVVHAYEVLGQGFAKTLVVTRLPEPHPSSVPAIRRQMDQMGLKFPIIETGEVSNTRDEAVEVAKLAKERGWPRVIVVSQPWHMQRAAGVFEKAGLRVICSPCTEGAYDISMINTFYERLRAFRDWAHERIGIEMYRQREWMD